MPHRASSEHNAGADDPLLGTVLAGRYVIEELLGAGGMGRIYRAEQAPLGRKVAIKVRDVRALGARENVQAHKRFLLEASTLSKLQHPNIVTVFDYGRLEGEAERWYMVMEFLAGETLHRRLRDVGFLPVEEALQVVRQVARGLREAHRNGVVHRDLKPSNVMLVADDDGGEVVKIVDFGLVKVLADGAEELTREGVFLGSPRYMSPEQIAHGKVDHRTDVYSLGVILYECLCGRVPFEAESSIQTLIAHMQSPPPPMRERNPEALVHPRLEELARRCLEKAPQRRPATMDDLLEDLLACEVAMGLAPETGVAGFSGQQPHAPGPAADAEPDLAEPAEAPPPVRRTSHLRAPTIPAAPRALVFAPASDPEAPPAAVRPSLRAPAAPARADAVRANRNALYGLMALTGVLSVVAVWLAARPAATPTAVQAPAPMPATYELTVESETDGAQVYEGAALLGAAPLTLTVDNPVVTTRPRQLQVRRAGFLPVVVSVGPSALARARVAVRLTAEPPPAAPPAEPPTYTLIVSSPVAFAQVYEGASRIGTTPLRVEVINAAVRARPRRFEVRRIGFEPYAFDVGPAAGPTLVEARLQELPPRIVLTRPAAPPLTARPAAPPLTARPAAPPLTARPAAPPLAARPATAAAIRPAPLSAPRPTPPGAAARPPVARAREPFVPLLGPPR